MTIGAIEAASATTGSSTLKNAQPFVVDCFRGQIAVAHNGNLINAAVLRDELESKGSIFQTTADSEIIPHLLAQPSKNGGSPLSANRLTPIAVAVRRLVLRTPADARLDASGSRRSRGNAA